MDVHGTQYFSDTAGSVMRAVCCEKCGHQYQYELVRRGVGTASTVYGIASDWAQERAAAKAERVLQQRLKTGADPVPCPRCGWLQADMVREINRRRYRALRWWGWRLGLACLPFLLLILYVLVSSRLWPPPTSNGRIMLAAALGGTVLGLGLPLVIVPLLKRLFDPNANYRTRLAATDSSAAGSSAASAGEVVASASSKGKATGDGSRWWSVQLLHVRYPNLCCVCLASDVQMAHASLMTYAARVPFPICAACTRTRARRRMLVTTTIGLAAAIAAGVTNALIVRPPIMGMVVSCALVAGLGVGALAWYIAPWIRRPMRYRRFNGELNTIDLRFRNPTFHQVFVDVNR